jgi:hypothetical protein
MKYRTRIYCASLAALIGLHVDSVKRARLSHLFQRGSPHSSLTACTPDPVTVLFRSNLEVGCPFRMAAACMRRIQPVSAILL